VLNAAAGTPVVGNKGLKKKAERLNKLAKKGSDLNGMFEFFVEGNWKFENLKINKIINLLSPEERREFPCDIMKIEWFEFIRNYTKGLSIWCLHED